VLAKTYIDGDLAVIKPSSMANGAMRGCLVGRPSNRAVFLYRSLPSFLAAMLRTHDNRQDGLADLAVRLGSGRSSLRAASTRRQPLARRLAALWLLHVELFLELLPEVPATRLCSLDAGAFLAAPRATLAALGRAFGFSWSKAEIAEVAAGPVLRRDAKHLSRSYDDGARRAEIAKTRSRWRDEIADAVDWCGRQMGGRVPDSLPRPLVVATPGSC